MSAWEPKLWVQIRAAGCRCGDRGWRPVSIEDLFRIVAHLVHCENIKYESRPQPSKLPVESLIAAANFVDRTRGAFPSVDAFDREWLSLAPRLEMPPRSFAPISKRWSYLDVEFTKPLSTSGDQAAIGERLQSKLHLGGAAEPDNDGRGDVLEELQREALSELAKLGGDP